MRTKERNPIRALAVWVLPPRLRAWLRSQQRRLHLQWPPLKTVEMGNLRRLTPISSVFGLDRGLPVDRYYIEQFLTAHTAQIRGRVLEMGDDFYTRKFGGDRVDRSDVLHYVAGSPGATIIGDLTSGDEIPSDTFDSIIFTQTLQVIFDVRAALRTLYRILRPGGVLLTTSNGIKRIGRREGIDPWGEYWHFTSQSTLRFFGEIFPAGNLRIHTYGNVLSAVAFLHGLAAEELEEDELEYRDPDYEVIVTVRAVKPLSAPTASNGHEAPPFASAGTW